MPSNIGVRRREPNAAEAPGGVQGQRPDGGSGGQSLPEAEAFYSSKIKLESLGSTQITKMDSNN